MKITVKIFSNDEEIISKVFSEGIYKLGREDGNDIQLTDEKISRTHLEIRVTNSSAYFTNLSSGGKVIHNGRPAETGELASGDGLNLGSYRHMVIHGTEHERPKE